MDVSAATLSLLLAVKGETAEPQKIDRTDHFRIGAIGGIGFPRPLAIEGMVEIERTLGLGLEYGALPTITTPEVQVSYWALAGDARFFFARGPFFIGMKVGMQHLAANAAMTVSSITVSEQLMMETWFVNPRLGLLFTWKPGFTLGIDAGVQLPVASTTTSSVPLSLLPAPVVSTANALGTGVLPTIDLLRIGFLL
jgi:hypothetical protein